MSSAFTVRPYMPGDDRRILRLFNEVFGEDNPDFVARTLEEWRWEFLQNPAGTTIFVGVTPEGRIISQYACLPVAAHVHGERVPAIQGIDSVVHPDWRRGLSKRGAFLVTAKAFFDYWGVPERNAFGWGFPNSRVYRIGVKLLGYRPIAEPLQVLYRNLFEHSDDHDVAAGLGGDLQIEESGELGPEVDRLFARLAGEYPVAVWRDARYLTWRYVDCPVADYRILVIRDEKRGGAGDEIRALAVVRPGWQGRPILGVAEWMVSQTDAEAGGALLRAILALGRRAGQVRLEMWHSPGSMHYDMLQRLGLQVEASPYNLCVMPYREDLTTDDFRRDFRYSLGDVDVF